MKIIKTRNGWELIPETNKQQEELLNYIESVKDLPKAICSHPLGQVPKKVLTE